MTGSPCGQVVVEQLPAETLVATGAVGDNLICQAIINSGIGLETETTMPAESTTTMVTAAAVVEGLGQEEVEEEEVEEVEHQQSPETIEKVLFEDPDSEQIHVTEECVEMELEVEEVEVSECVCVCALIIACYTCYGLQNVSWLD